MPSSNPAASKPRDGKKESQDRHHKSEIVTDTGKPVAGACDEETAEDVANCLNSDRAREEEDRWA